MNITKERYERLGYRHEYAKEAALGSLLGSAATLEKDYLPLIAQAGSAAGSIATAVKCEIDAVKSAEELRKLREFNKLLEDFKYIKDIKELNTEPKENLFP